MLPQVPESTERLRLAASRGEIGRRDLLQSLLPKDRAVPYIDSLRCRGERCQLCRQSCAFEAVAVDRGVLSIDRPACRSCGLCIAACPRGAIVHPEFPPHRLRATLAELLPAQGNAAEPKLVAMICHSARYSSHEEKGLLPHPPGVLLLEMPCLSMASPWLMLRAFGLGAQGLALICDSRGCPLRIDPERWRGTVRFVQALLSQWGIQPERVGLLGEGDPGEELPRFQRAVAVLAPISLPRSVAPALPEYDLSLAALIEDTSQRLGAIAAGTISAGAVPFGKVRLHGADCTGCGLCAGECPTGALGLVSAGPEAYRLSFSHRCCTSCGLCAQVCPEGCLEVERMLELDRLGSPPQIIWEGGLVSCQMCGAPIAPRAMVEKIRARVAATGGNTSQLETCPDCKMGVRPKSVGSRAGG
ncbi:MAG: hydrogenase iron-sulfur subunit [Chloroflexi bacterium]|nr:hydrogenase iron-sulfur subunit [Chloroflexota bacterium]